MYLLRPTTEAVLTNVVSGVFVIYLAAMCVVGGGLLEGIFVSGL